MDTPNLVKVWGRGDSPRRYSPSVTTLVTCSINKQKYFLHRRKGPLLHKDTLRTTHSQKPNLARDPELGALSAAAQRRSPTPRL